MKKAVAIVLAALATAALAQTPGQESFRQRMLARSGGVIETAIPDDAKRVVLIDAREKKGGELDAFKKALAGMFRFPVSVGGDYPAAVKIVLADKGDFTVLPLEGVATVPAGADAAETQARLWKALFSVLAADMNVGSQESYLLARRALEARGMTEIKRATYRRAVQEGWAPAPTNEFQRAIFEAAKAAAASNGVAAPAAKPQP